jgi:hypothetical protein
MHVTCPECQARLVLAPPAPGNKLRCPKCEAIFAPPKSAWADSSATRRSDRPHRRPPPGKQGLPTGQAVVTFLAAALLLVGAATTYVLQSRFSGPDGGFQVGETAPEIKGEDIDGIPFTLSDYRGKVVVLDFWGHW